MPVRPNIQRFVNANDNGDQVLVPGSKGFQFAEGELYQGKKETDWMWYIFPILRGFSDSQMAEKYAISSLEEACAFLQNEALFSHYRALLDRLFELPKNIVFNIHTMFG